MSLVSKRNYTQGPAPSGENRFDGIEDDPIIYRLHSYDVKVASIMFYMSKRASNGAAVTVMISATVPRPTPHVSAASEGNRASPSPPKQVMQRALPARACVMTAYDLIPHERTKDRARDP